MAEMWSKVGVGFQMVHIVLVGAAVDAQRNETRRGPREVVATVVLDGDVHVINHEGPCGEQVAPEDDGVHGGPEAHGEQLPAAQALSGQSKWRGVVVMDGVEGDVEPAHPVVENVPDEVLQVKEQEVGQDSSQQVAQARGSFGKVQRRPPQPLGHRRRQHQEHMVVQGDACTVQQHGGGRTAAGLDLELLDPGPPVSHHVANQERDAEDEVGGHGEDDGEERRPQVVSVVQPQAVPQRLQQGLSSPASGPEISAGRHQIHPAEGLSERPAGCGHRSQKLKQQQRLFNWSVSLRFAH